jgi:hypothetical protein
VQGIEDWMQEQLAEVVDAVRNQRGDGEVVGPALALRRREVFEVDAGEVEEGVFVVGGEF